MSHSRFMHFHHVGIAVRNIDRSAEAFAQAFGATLEEETFHDEHQRVRIRFLRIGDLRVELLEPAGEGSPLENILKRGIGIYHSCHEVEDLDATLEQLKRDGVKVISPPKPAVAFGNRRVAFTMCEGSIIELLEAEVSAP